VIDFQEKKKAHKALKKQADAPESPSGVLHELNLALLHTRGSLKNATFLVLFM
jgi:hypothetical protein